MSDTDEQNQNLSDEQRKLLAEHQEAVASIHDASAKLARINKSLIEGGLSPIRGAMRDDMGACW